MGKPKILIASPDAGIVKDTAKAIQDFARVLSHSIISGGDVLRVTGELGPDLVLLDCGLPGSCVETAAEIRKRFSIPVVFMTDRVDDPALRQAKEPPCFVLKPVTGRALEPLVDFVLKSHALARRDPDDAGGIIHALRESERMYSTLISNLPGFVYRCANDRDWTMEFISDGCREITGYPADTFIGNRNLAFNDIIHPDYREPLWNKWQEALRVQMPFEDEYPIITAAGETRWLWERGRGIFSGDGALLFLEGFITDITDRKKALEDLGKGEERYRLLYENAAEGIFTYDRNLVITDVNRRACEIFGYDRSEVIGRTILEIGILHPDDIPHAAENMARLINGADALSSRYKFIRKDGALRRCNVTGAAIRGKNGEVMSITSIVVDVTDQVRVEEALRASDERYRALFQGAAEGILVADIDTMRFTRANPAICSFLGYSEEELVGMGVPDIHPPGDLDHVIREFKVPLETGTSLAAGIPCLRKDGAVVYADIYNSLMILDGRRSTVGFFIDITQRKEAERELVQSEQKFRSVVEKSHMGIAIVNDRAEYIYVNDEFCRIAGYPREYLLGKNFDFPLSEESRAMAIDRYVRRQRGESVPDHYEFSFIRSSGDVRTGEVRSAVYQDSTGRVNSLIQVLDVTERRQAEEERRQFEAKIQQAQKLESLGVLAGGIAHDFNNLLMAILGNVDLALMDLSPASPVRPNLLEAAKASQRAADLCRQMLAYSGKGRFVVEAVDLNDLVEEMARMLEVSISKKAVLSYNFARDLPAIEADATQLRQVVMNLVINASEAIGRAERRHLDHHGLHAVRPPLPRRDLAGREHSRGLLRLPRGGRYRLRHGRGDHARRSSIPSSPRSSPDAAWGWRPCSASCAATRGRSRSTASRARGTTFKVLFPAAGAPGGARSRRKPGAPTDWTGERDRAPGRRRGDRARPRRQRCSSACGFTVLTAADGREALDLFRERAAEIALRHPGPDDAAHGRRRDLPRTAPAQRRRARDHVERLQRAGGHAALRRKGARRFHPEAVPFRGPGEEAPVDTGLIFSP